jgi:hypothetical protein
MKPVHYFQRFSRREDVVTNNTLLLLSRLQSKDHRLLGAVLAEAVDDDGLVVGAQIAQQIRGGEGSVPDGRIFQSAFELLIETKLGDAFGRVQLEEHLERFTIAEQRFLLLLSPEAPRHLRELRRMAGDRGVVLVSLTFARLVEICRGAISGHDFAMAELIEDYESFCSHERLLAEAEARMLVVSARDSIEDNRELLVYYDPVSREHQAVGFLGFYAEKAVRGIGRIRQEVCADLVDGDLRFSEPPNPKLTAEQRRHITTAMERADAYKWNIRSGHRFTLLESFEPTNFRKSGAPMRRWKYFDLREVLGMARGAALPAAAEIAERLNERTWE